MGAPLRIRTSGYLRVYYVRQAYRFGEYDGEMRNWGAENIEQSVRIWLCGGEIVVARDSFVAHVFRKKFPYPVNETEVMLNKVRTVEVWFDSYKEKFYSHVPSA